MTEQVKIIDLNAFKRYDELLKNYINEKIKFAEESDILSLFEVSSPETSEPSPASVDAIEEW